MYLQNAAGNGLSAKQLHAQPACVHSRTTTRDRLQDFYVQFYFYTCIDGDRYVGIASSKDVNVRNKIRTNEARLCSVATSARGEKRG